MRVRCLLTCLHEIRRCAIVCTSLLFPDTYKTDQALTGQPLLSQASSSHEPSFIKLSGAPKIGCVKRCVCRWECSQVSYASMFIWSPAGT